MKSKKIEASEDAVSEQAPVRVQLNPAYDPLAVVNAVRYYTYCPKTFVATGYVDGTDGETLPEFSTKWAPPVCDSDQQAYYNGCGWVRGVPYKSLTPELLRQALTDVVQRELRTAMANIKAGAADDETETYLQQYADAQTYLRTGEASTFLMVLSNERNKEVEDLARVIMRKADAYHTAVAKALASYQNAVDVIANTEPVLTQALLQERRLQRV